MRDATRQRGRLAADGFTLLELLIVVALIALLTGIMVPSLSSARELARRALCAGHQHHIYTALNMYLVKHRSLPPLTRSPDIVVPPEGQAGMSDADLRMTPWDLFPVIYHGNNSGPEHSRYTNFGPLYELGYIEDIRLFYCPSQTHPDFQFDTHTNPWPIEDPEPIEAEYKRWNHVFSSYGRRLGLSNIAFDIVPPQTAIISDVAMFPWYTRTHHQDAGFNVLTVDGAVEWNDDPWYHTYRPEYDDYNFYDAIRHCIDVFDRLSGIRRGDD